MNNKFHFVPFDGDFCDYLDALYNEGCLFGSASFPYDGFVEVGEWIDDMRYTSCFTDGLL